jgi:cytochrome d ubiquinol oxidase subunit I
VWAFFTGALVIYVAVGAGTVLVLRSMRRRWAEGTDGPDVPYGPRERPVTPARPAPS